MAKVKLTKKDITKKLLEDVAQEFNSEAVMNYESPIPTGKKITKEALQKDIIEASKDLQPKDTPNLTPKTIEVLEVLGVKIPVVAEVPATVKGDETKPDTDKAEKAAEKGATGPQGKPKGESEERGSKGKSEKKTSKTRVESFVDIINGLSGPTTVEKLAEAINSDYVSVGGKDNIKQSLHLTKVMMPCAIAFGKVKVTDGRIIPLK